MAIKKTVITKQYSSDNEYNAALSIQGFKLSKLVAKALKIEGEDTVSFGTNDKGEYVFLKDPSSKAKINDKFIVGNTALSNDLLVLAGLKSIKGKHIDFAVSEVRYDEDEKADYVVLTVKEIGVARTVVRTEKADEAAPAAEPTADTLTETEATAAPELETANSVFEIPAAGKIKD